MDAMTNMFGLMSRASEAGESVLLFAVMAVVMLAIWLGKLGAHQLWAWGVELARASAPDIACLPGGRKIGWRRWTNEPGEGVWLVRGGLARGPPLSGGRCAGRPSGGQRRVGGQHPELEAAAGRLLAAAVLAGKTIAGMASGWMMHPVSACPGGHD